MTSTQASAKIAVLSVALLVVAALLALTIYQAVWVFSPHGETPAAPSTAGAAVPGVGGAGLDLTQSASQGAALGAAGFQGGTRPTGVIPLTWTGTEGTLYTLQVQLGQGSAASTVTAAFDTGSSRVVILQGYTPGASAQGIPDPTTGGPCSATVAYVSQSATVTAYQDTAVFGRVGVAPLDLCTAGVSQVISSAPATGSLTVQSLPIAAASSSSPGAINVFGMSAVLTTTMVGSQYETPDCLTFSTPAYESPLLQVLSTYYAGTGSDLVWSMMLGRPAVENTPGILAGFVAFGPVAAPACMALQYTPLVPSLPNASSALGQTPGRYYVVSVTRCAVGTKGTPLSTYVDVPSFPTYLLLDSGTSLVQLPGAASAGTVNVLNAISGNQEAIVVLDGNVTLTFGPNDVTYGPSNQPVFQVMPDATAQQFSSLMDTGILGAVGLWGLLVEFNLTKGVVGFGQPPV
jgi:hypothetical protein